MKAFFRTWSFLMTITAFATTSAQVSHGGLAFGRMEHGPRLDDPVTLRMPAVDAAALMAEDEARLASGALEPYRFGYVHDVNIIMDQGIWTTLDNGDRIWRLAIECPEAKSIGFFFSHYVVPEGALLFLYNEMDEQRGAFMASPSGRTTLAVDQLAGERVILEYFEPAAVQGQGALEIGRVIHAYRGAGDPQRGYGESGICNVNVICPQGDPWRDQIRAVAIINTGAGHCTGTLMNNCLGDGIPYMITADHCLVSPLETWTFRFNWDSPDCDPTQDNLALHSISGAELLATNELTDMAFIRLNDMPPDEYQVFYSGWNNAFTPAQSVTGIHHPMGDIKKISLDGEPVVAELANSSGQFYESWKIDNWDEGTAEPGSSGSGLWDQNGLFVGQLIGGADGICGTDLNTAVYGRLDLSFPVIEEWLGGCGPELPGIGFDEVVIPIYNDAAVTSISQVPALLCGSNSITPRITLKNNGIHVLTSVLITYGLLGGLPAVHAWSGSLLPGQTLNYDLPAMEVPPGEHILEITANSPNGVEDQVLENDSWIFPFTVNSPDEMINLLLQTDNYGTEVTWELVSAGNIILYQGGPYDDVVNGEYIQIPFCLTNGCYTFTINDFFGDGICCQEGQGNYSIQSGNGTVFANSNGDYGTQNVNVFCLEGVNVPELESNVGLSIHPNPTNGSLILSWSSTATASGLMLFDGMGRIVLDRSINAGIDRLDLDLSDLSEGVYTLMLQTEKGRPIERVVLQR